MAGITSRAARALRQTNIEPIFVLEIEGVDTLFTSNVLKKKAKYGDAIVYEPGDLEYGGFIEVEGHEALIDLDSTSSKISQQLEPDKARTSSVSSMKVTLVDFEETVTKLLASEELLGRNIRYWIGFGEADWKKDYINIFKGLIDDIDIGTTSVTFFLTHPDQKKRTTRAEKVNTKLTTDINDSQTNVALIDASLLLQKVASPALGGLKDDSLETYVMVTEDDESEVIQYDTIVGNTLTNVVRGRRGTVPMSFTTDAEVESFYVLRGDPMSLALKMMLSDKDTSAYKDTLSPTSVNYITASISEADTFFFINQDLIQDYNITTGDFLTATGFSEGANNVTDAIITNIFVDDLGTHIKVDQTLTTQVIADGQLSFFSRYNTLGSLGVAMSPEEIDIEKHEFLLDNFLNSSFYEFFLKEEIDDVREFIELELYKPVSCYAIPRFSQASVAYHIGPLPTETTPVLDTSNITNPQSLRVKRSLNNNYYNKILFRYNDALPYRSDNEKLANRYLGVPVVDPIPVDKTLIIESLGLRDDLGAQSTLLVATTRLLDRYQTAAESIPSIKVLFGDAVQLNVGDIVTLDPEGLSLFNPLGGDREREKALFEIVNLELDLIRAEGRVKIVNTNFSLESRYCLMAPASEISRGNSESEIVIREGSVGSPFGADEFRKWEPIPDAGVEIHSPDYSITANAKIKTITGNIIELDRDLGFIPAEGYIMDLASYDFAGQTEQVKLIYGFMSDDDNDFADGGRAYQMI